MIRRRTNRFCTTVLASLLGWGTALVVQAQTPASAPTETPPLEIRLWPGKAPGTENWAVPEATTTSPSGERTVSNVSDPTLTVFLPDPAIATGTAIVLAPGGAMRVLGIDSNGTQVARWLNARGIAAFVLKYRTVQQAAGARGGAGPGPGFVLVQAAVSAPVRAPAGRALRHRRARNWKSATPMRIQNPTMPRSPKLCRWRLQMARPRCD